MPKPKTNPKKAQAPTRQRRGLEQRIAELDAKLAALRQRIAAKQDPSLRHALAARKSLDRALEVADNAETRKALGAARQLLAGILGQDATPSAARVSGQGNGAVRARGRLDSERLLAHVLNHPGQRGEQISEALGLDTVEIRPVMKRLIAEGKVRTAGQRRGMTYTAV